MDRRWMYDRLYDAKSGRVKEVFKLGVELFIEAARQKPVVAREGGIRCPCVVCQCRHFHPEDVIKYHLCHKGFQPNYWVWTSHGEVIPPNYQAASSSGLRFTNFTHANNIIGGGNQFDNRGGINFNSGDNSFISGGTNNLRVNNKDNRNHFAHNTIGGGNQFVSRGGINFNSGENSFISGGTNDLRMNNKDDGNQFANNTIGGGNQFVNRGGINFNSGENSFISGGTNDLRMNNEDGGSESAERGNTGRSTNAKRKRGRSADA